VGFGLERTSVILDDNEFEAFKEETTNQHYFAERVAIKGELKFGLIPRGQEVQIDLAKNGITTPIMLTELFAFTPIGTSDEVKLRLYVKNGEILVKIGTQRISAGQMPYNIPNGIIRPDMVISIEPTRSDSTVIAYAKPVAVTFEAIPTFLIDLGLGSAGDNTVNR